MQKQKSEFERMVEENYKLVYVFLQTHGYSGDSYYDAAVDGLLAAAHDYCERPETRRYAFSTIAFHKMDDAARAVVRKEKRRSEIAQILHLEDPNEVASHTHHFESTYDFTQRVENEMVEHLMMAQMLAALTKKQMEVLELIRRGYSYNEMANRCGVGYAGINSRLYRMRNKLKQIQVTLEWE